MLVTALGAAAIAGDPPPPGVPGSKPPPTDAGAPGAHAERPAPAPPGPTSIPDDATLEANDAIIGEIIIDNGDIFDPDRPGENRLIYRWANKAHINTRANVIRRLLLFKTGDPYSGRKLRESERLLRDAPYVYDADIRIVRYESNRVDLAVETRDVWTLKGGVGFGREGGVNTYRLGIEDSNFLGWGKELTFEFSDKVERRSILYRYRDPNVGGSRVRMVLAYRDNSDGEMWAVDAGKPFYSFDTRWAVGGRALSDLRTDQLWALGKVVDEFRHEETAFEASGGVSKGLVGRRAARWRFGLTYREDLFAPLAEAPGGEVPDDRRLIYPWLGYESVEDRFREVHDLDQIARTEDVDLGHSYLVRLGYSSEAFGANRNQFILSGRYQAGLTPDRRQMLLFTTLATGRFGPSGTENVRLGGTARYYLRDLGRHMFFVRVEAEASHDLDPENQLLLGGDSGIRGYPLRYQAGNRRAVLTIEQRFYTDIHVLKLVRVGAAVFLDAGMAWFADEDDPTELGLLRDVGFGLRLGSSRSSSGSLVHIDVAFPLDGPDTLENVQFFVTSRESF